MARKLGHRKKERKKERRKAIKEKRTITKSACRQKRLQGRDTKTPDERERERETDREREREECEMG